MRGHQCCTTACRNALVTPPAGWHAALLACLLASLVSYRPLDRRLRKLLGSSGKLSRRRVVRVAWWRRSRTRPRWESLQRRALCAIKGAAWLGRARRGASGSALLTRHAIGQRITGQPLRWGSPQLEPHAVGAMEAPPSPGSHLSPVRREAPPVAPADEESVIEIPPEVLAQQRVDALEAKLDALLNGGPRYQPVVKDEPVVKKEAWGRAEGCAAVSRII